MEKSARRNSVRVLVFWFAAVLLSPSGWLLCSHLALAPLPEWLGPVLQTYEFAGMLLAPVWIAGLAAPLAALASFLYKPARQAALPFLGIAALCWGFFLIPYPDPLRSVIPSKAKPLIAAIDQYRADHGTYPEDLAALTPTYLTEIPSTGACAYPKFNYSTDAGRYYLWVNLALFATLSYSPAGEEGPTGWTYNTD